jgi:hypothetical protein
MPEARGLAQTLFCNVCDLPKVRFAEGCDETPRPPPWSPREIAESKLQGLRQPALNRSTPLGLPNSLRSAHPQVKTCGYSRLAPVGAIRMRHIPAPMLQGRGLQLLPAAHFEPQEQVGVHT